MALFRSALIGTCLLASAAAAQTAPRITTPMQQLGHNFGDDYFLASYKQLSAYWEKLSGESDRMVLDTIGRTAEGRPQLMAIVTSAANHRNLARYKEIARRLALAEGLTDDQARALANEGKAVVWIDGGLHATEVLGAQQLGEIVYQMLSRTDAETMRILDNVVILFVHANPDGNDLTAEWYMRNPVPEQRGTGPGIPRLYQKYIGHDNNRDFFASTQPESENMNRVLYREWFPQILYNHHQSGPAGTVLWAPPLRDPFNYNQDPLIPLGITQVAMAMHIRLAAEGKPGATMRSGGAYDGWWNGGLRNTATFHNIIGLLTEMIGNPTPTQIPLVMSRQLPSSDLPYPVAPQRWHFRQSIEYSLTTNRAVLDLAAREKENFLFNIYRMGKNSIERGSRDTWTPWPERLDAVATRIAGASGGRGGAGGRGGGGGGGFARDSANYELMRDPRLRDPRGYILPSDQPDFPTATRFINALLETGITVHRATRPFSVAGKQYPAGSFVVKTAQAFRPHVLDMFEPQDHPDVIPYPGAPPTRPYDNAGWTLALQMGVQFDRILEGFDGPFEVIPEWNLSPVPGRVIARGNRIAGYVMRHESNNAFTAVNRLLAAGSEVSWLLSTTPMQTPGAELATWYYDPAFPPADHGRPRIQLPAGQRPSGQPPSVETQPAENPAPNMRAYIPGTFFITARPETRAIIDRASRELGVSFEALPRRPASVEVIRLKAPRIGLWDRYGGSMPSGWTRWILEQFEFPYEVVYPPMLDAGNLGSRYDVLIFVDGAIPATTSGGGGAAGAEPQGASDLPPEWQARQGNISAERTIPALKAFLAQGGTVLAIGSSATNLAAHLDLGLTNHLVEKSSSGQPTTTPLPPSKYFVPGSVLDMRVDVSNPVAHGLSERTNVFFDESPVWAMTPAAASQGIRRIAWYDSPTPLVSGWAWGQAALENGLAVVEAPVGPGRVVLFAPEILQRGQPHGTFKLLFNSLYYPTGTRTKM
jgi:hypothetical protein